MKNTKKDILGKLAASRRRSSNLFLFIGIIRNQPIG